MTDRGHGAAGAPTLGRAARWNAALVLIPTSAAVLGGAVWWADATTPRSLAVAPHPTTPAAVPSSAVAAPDALEIRSHLEQRIAAHSPESEARDRRLVRLRRHMRDLLSASATASSATTGGIGSSGNGGASAGTGSSGKTRPGPSGGAPGRSRTGAGSRQSAGRSGSSGSSASSGSSGRTSAPTPPPAYTPPAPTPPPSPSPPPTHGGTGGSGGH